MKIVKSWVLAFIAAAGLIGGATATIVDDAPLRQGSEIASHDQNEGPGDEGGEGEKGDKGGGESDDKGDDDATDVNDTDGPGDDEDD
ncbi:MAG TPA: hypothetical protein VG795_04390 [Acidimicrobiia bacterium]|nr:hypothetical protein [Acidimicrobiia bacterium]